MYLFLVSPVDGKFSEARVSALESGNVLWCPRSGEECTGRTAKFSSVEAHLWMQRSTYTALTFATPCCMCRCSQVIQAGVATIALVETTRHQHRISLVGYLQSTSHKFAQFAAQFPVDRSGLLSSHSAHKTSRVCLCLPWGACKLTARSGSRVCKNTWPVVRCTVVATRRGHVCPLMHDGDDNATFKSVTREITIQLACVVQRTLVFKRGLAKLSYCFSCNAAFLW